MARRLKTGGRSKGTPNKLTKAARDAIAEAADRLGGVDRMVSWAQEDKANERIFWGTVYPKLLPLSLQGGGDDGGVIVNILRFGDGDGDAAK